MNDVEQITSKAHDNLVYCVYETLLECKGRAHAISAHKLSSIYGITERQLRSIVSEIRLSTDFEKVVAACPNGYFVCASDEEVDRANKALKLHALSELQVYWANERKAGRNGQGKIICGDDGKPFIEALAEAE